jgi:CheY-like chemotaxis protein
MNILVIDDELIIHESLKKTLSREGFHVYSAMSAMEGLEQLSSAPFDLIITDLMMPEIDGLELLHELRKASCQVPAIMITGYPTIRSALQALQLGAADYIPKPFTRKELLSPVMRALRRNELEGVYSEQEPVDNPEDASEEAPPTPAPLPGEAFCLPGHSWARYDQNGTVYVGIEASCLQALGRVVGIRLPSEDDLVEQGYPAIMLRNREGEEHNIFLPIGGRVVAINKEALVLPSRLNSETWLIQVIPSHLEADLLFLKRTDRLVEPKRD